MEPETRDRPDAGRGSQAYGQTIEGRHKTESSGEVTTMRALRTVEGALVIVGLLIAVPLAAIAIDMSASSDDHMATANGSHMSNPEMSGMMGSQTEGKPTTAAEQITIIHAQKGCHLWSDAGKQTAAMHVTMHTGQMLKVMNQDVDMHRMMEMSGPTMMGLGGPMKQGMTRTLTFAKPGTYTFGTKSSVMQGMPEVATIGPDNNLKLTVTVV